MTKETYWQRLIRDLGTDPMRRALDAYGYGSVSVPQPENAADVEETGDIYPVGLFVRNDGEWRVVLDDGRRISPRGTEAFVRYVDRRGDHVISTKAFVQWCRRGRKEIPC